MKSWNRKVTITLLALAAIVGAYALLKFMRPFGLEPWMVKDWTLKAFYDPVVRLANDTILTPAFFIAIGFTLWMERLFPADSRPKMFGVSFYQDLAWFFYETVLHAIVIISYVYWLKQLYYAYFSFLTIEAAAVWPSWVRFAVGVLLLDFLYWLQHYFNHKVPWFWQFHTVHHSQKEINFFTDYRYHIFEYIVRHTVLVIPFLILKVDVPTIVAFSIFRRWYTRFYHGNIRTNLGPLRYILVTPQSHRIHHSRLPQHQDLNFGSLFSIWDFLFRTQYYGFYEYPPSGISDEEFPNEKGGGFLQFLFMPLVQLAYPFRVIGRQMRSVICAKNLFRWNSPRGDKEDIGDSRPKGDRQQ